MKYDGGVVIAADTLGSYGSMARFPDLQRILKVEKSLFLNSVLLVTMLGELQHCAGCWGGLC